MWRPRALLPAAWISCLLVAGCGEESSIAPIDEPSVGWVPAPGAYTIVALEEMELVAVVDAPVAHRTEFRIEGEVVSARDTLVFRGTALGLTEVVAQVTVGEFVRTAAWQIEVVEEGLPPVPTPGNLVAETGLLPGSVRLRWDRPPVSSDLPRIVGYEIAYSTTPFAASEFDDRLMDYVADAPAVIRQRHQVSNLPERTVHYFRARSVDEVGRRSAPGFHVQLETTGHFDISGTFFEFRATSAPIPMADVVVDVAGRLTITGPDGRFAVTNILDTEAVVMRAEVASGVGFYPWEIAALAPMTRDLELVMLPVGTVSLEGTSMGDSMDLLDFWLLMTDHDQGFPPYDFVPWEQYPVTLYVHDYVQPGANVDYRASFERAVDLWNDGAVGDDRLLRIEYIAQELDPADYDATVGAFYTTEFDGTSPGQTAYGQVDFIRPIGGKRQQTVPELLVVRLRAALNFQSVADFVVAHEIGHVLGLWHSPSTGHLMYGAGKADGIPTEDEIFLARYLRYVGPDAQADWYAAESP